MRLPVSPSSSDPGGCLTPLILAAVILLLFAAPALAARPTITTDPDYLIDTWETEEGLPENSATAMVQSADGFLWFSTFGGLVRFDGVEFDVHRPTTSPGMPGAGIVNLHLDQRKRLWVSTYAGLATLTDGKWRTYTKDDGWTGDFVRTFAERESGDLLMTTFDGRILEFTGDRFRELPLPPGLPGRDYGGHVDEEGKWWAIQNGFVGRWDGQQWHSMIEPLPGTYSLFGGRARDGGLWLVQDRVITKHVAGVQVSRVELPQAPGGIWSIHDDSRGNLWICTHDKGVCRLSPDGAFRRYGLSNALAANGVRFVFEDHEKNIWIGTSGGGLSRFRPRRFQSLGVEAGLTEPNVKSISADGEGGLWIATYGGGLFRKDAKGLSRVEMPKGTPLVVQSVLADRAGRVWAGMYGSGPYVIEKDSIRAIAAADAGGGNGLALFEDSAGCMWVSGGQHVARFEGPTSRRYGQEKDSPLFGVSSFAQTSDGAIWACNGSVFRLENDVFTRIVTGTKAAMAISITADGDSLWIGMSDRSLLRWRGGTLATVPAKAGLTASVQGMVEDQLGCFWLATGNGIGRVERAALHAVADGAVNSLRIQWFDKTDGLPSLHCSGGRQPVCGRDGAGRLWFATLKGVASIDPAQLKLNDTPPPAVHFTQLRYRTPHAAENHTTAQQGDAASAQTILNEPFTAPVTLPAGSRQIEIHFAALSFATPQRVQYAVKLNDEDWESIGSRRHALFHDLPPDDYVLHVRAANGDGVWNPVGKAIAFSVTPFYWQRVWFKLGAGFLLVTFTAGLAAWIVHSRGRLRRQGEERFRLVVESSPSAMVVTDAHGIILMTNKQAETIFSYDRSEMINRPVERLLPARYEQSHPELRKAYMKKPEARVMGAGRELHGRRKDGSEFPVEIGLTPIDSPSGVLVLASITDISERRRAELESSRQRNELAHLSRVTMLGELSGSLAHELNQPLASILSNAQAAQRFLARDNADLNEVREILTDIVDQDKRAGEVIRRLRLLLKKGEVQRQPVSINEIVQEVLKLVRSDLINHGITVEIELAPDLPAVDGDRVQLQQVLLNLVMNGCDAMATMPASRKQLRVITQHEPGGVHLLVVDAGTGIAAHSLEKIFEPFFTTKESGMGLGLAVCRTIVSAHGGRLWATNNPQGGATLHCMLPAGKSVP